MSSPRHGSCADRLVGALTAELLRALRDECESDARSAWTVVFRGVLARLVALNDALVAGSGRCRPRDAEADGERERQRLMGVVVAIRRAVQSERSVTRSSGGAVSTRDGEPAALATSDRSDRDDCDALRMLALAPLREEFARELHERVTEIARGIVGDTHEERSFVFEEDGAAALDDDDDGSESDGPSEEPPPEDDQGALKEEELEWIQLWNEDCQAQIQYFDALLDDLRGRHAGSDSDSDDDDDAGSCTSSDSSDSCSSASDDDGSDDDKSSDEDELLPTTRAISQMLAEHQMRDECRGLLERALAAVNEGKRARRLLSSAREKSRWRRLASRLDGSTWRSIYDPDSCSEASKLAFLAPLRAQFKLETQSSMRSLASSDSGEFSQSRSESGAGIARRLPKWLIPVSEISLVGSVSDDSFQSRGVTGRWLDADVLFKPIRLDQWADIADKSATSPPVVAEIEQCYRLSHPNVAKLFGVCYDGEQYFCVCEYEEWSSLSDFARFADDKEVWQVLYEAALGLQFLHSSGVAHGNLRPSSIVVGSDGLANIDMIGTRMAVMEESMLISHCFEDDKAQWAAPECLRGEPGSFGSDVYSLGMLILGEFNGGDNRPWGNEEYSIQTMRRAATMGDLPSRPEALNDAEWALVTQMCAFDSLERPSISNVVRSISILLEETDEASEEDTAGKRETWGRILEGAEQLERLHLEAHVCIGVIPSLESIHRIDPDGLGTTIEAYTDSIQAGHLSRRWVAPEMISVRNDACDEVGEGDPCESRLQDAFAADVYSLGILIIEAVTRDYAWGSKTLDIVAGAAKLEGSLPPQAPGFSEQQWCLVERMCARDAGSRLSVSQVVDELREFAYDKSAQLAESSASSTISDCGLDSRHASDEWVDDGARSSDDQVPEFIEAGSKGVAELLVPALGMPASAVLQSMRRLLETDSVVSIEANWDVLRRLETIYNLARLSPEVMASEVLNQYCAALLRFWYFLNESASVGLVPTQSKRLARGPSQPLVSSGSCVRNNFVFHRLLDSVMTALTDARNLSTSVSVHDWRAKWFETRNSQLHVFRGRLSIDSSIEEENSDAGEAGSSNEASDDDCAGSETVDESSSPTPVDADHDTSDHNASGQALSTCLPSWFIPAFDVVFDELHLLGSGSFGSVHKATWLGAPVVVKKITAAFEDSTQRALFDREVSIWYRLHHPHIVKLFGACHVGQPFFVCEHALFGRLDRYLAHRARQQAHDRSFSRVALAWAKIYEACLGLQYLHERDVIHADLKCDNILVAMDGKAKLSDFGLSSIARTRQSERFQHEANASDAMCLGAIRWKAPEVLAGGSPTRASDVYGMAMCLVEAVTGLYPWGNSIPDVAVAFHVKRGKLPRRPAPFSEAEWMLVEAMCRFDPLERLRIGEVVRALAARVELAQIRAVTVV